MKLRRWRRLVAMRLAQTFSLLLLLVGAALADTVLIDFDDRDALAGNISLDANSPYQGFTWTNFSIYTTTPGFPGFNNGIVSNPNAAFTGGDDLGIAIVGKITAVDPFDFNSASVGSGWLDALRVTAEGRLGGTLQFAQTMTVNTAGAQFFNFAFTGVDELDFFSTITDATTDPFEVGFSGNSQFTFDNMDFSAAGPPPPPIPEPSTVAVLFSSIGLLAFGVSRCRMRL